MPFSGSAELSLREVAGPDGAGMALAPAAVTAALEETKHLERWPDRLWPFTDAQMQFVTGLIVRVFMNVGRQSAADPGSPPATAGRPGGAE